MIRRSLPLAALFFTAGLGTPAAGFDFYGRSGDGVLLDFSRQPGVAPGAVFSNLSLTTFTTHTALTSDVLEGVSFSQSGRLHVFADHNRGPGRGGDTNPLAPGFQGTVAGAVDIDGVTHDFSLTFQPGYTGTGRGSVGQSLEGLGRTNNPVFVAQQQHRLAYFNFQQQGGGTPAVTGTFDADTDEALRTFQAAFTGGLNTTQNSVDGIIGPNTAGWLNAGNAPRWERLETNADISSVSSFEPYATSWTNDLIYAATADAKAATGNNQRITGLSTLDGYGSSAIHSTHRAGMDIDLGIPLEARNLGNGSLNAGEADAAEYARAFLDAHLNHPELDGRVARILTSNTDVLAEINRTHPGGATYDSSGGHDDHHHLDITPRFQAAAPFNLAGDFNLDDTRDDADIDLLFANLGGDPGVYNLAGSAGVVDAVDVAFMITNVLGTTFGDANLSGQVEQGDLDAVLSNWGATATGWAGGDLNGNGQVEQGDLDQVLSHWGQGGSPDFGGAAVPEPAAVSAFVLAAVALRHRPTGPTVLLARCK